MITGYIWAVLWFILAAYLFYLAFRESRLFFIIAPFFVFLGGWALADELLEVDLMGGVYGWIYRGVAVIVLIIYGVIFFNTKRKNR